MIVRILSYPQGPRVWIAGQRVHHGATGCVLAAALAHHHPRLALLALAAVAHDRHDWREWFKRETVPAGIVQDRVSILTQSLDSQLSKV